VTGVLVGFVQEEWHDDKVKIRLQSRNYLVQLDNGTVSYLLLFVWNHLTLFWLLGCDPPGLQSLFSANISPEDE